MDAGETYTALQTNMIDATENPLFFIYSGNTHEVQDYLTLGQHHIYVTSTIFNAEYLASLPPDVRHVVQDTVDDLEQWSFDVQTDMNAEALANMQDSDITIVELDDAQRAELAEQSLPVRAEVGGVLGPDAERIMTTLLDEIERAEQAG